MHMITLQSELHTSLCNATGYIFVFLNSDMLNASRDRTRSIMSSVFPQECSTRADWPILFLFPLFSYQFWSSSGGLWMYCR